MTGTDPTGPEGPNGAPVSPVGWQTAWSQSLQSWAADPEGLPVEHFRTSVHVGAEFFAALARVAVEVDAGLGHPDNLDIVDVGAGGGELLVGLLSHLPADVADRVHSVAIDLRARPASLDARVTWRRGAADQVLRQEFPEGVRGLLIAHEFLDEIPLDVVQRDADGVRRLVLVDPAAELDAAPVEFLGPALDDGGRCARFGVDAARARAWLDTWWPDDGKLDGYRAEVGWPRDEAWSALVGSVRAGTALAMDYGHSRSERTSGRRRHGSLAGYRRGRHVAPLPDGRRNLTAHVAIDACVAAAPPGFRTVVQSQREVLQELVDDLRNAETLATQLQRTNDRRVLMAPAGLGAMIWLRHDRVGPTNSSASD